MAPNEAWQQARKRQLTERVQRAVDMHPQEALVWLYWNQLAAERDQARRKGKRK